MKTSKRLRNWSVTAGIALTGLIAVAQDQCQVVGWATENGGVTGGGDATPVVVSNYNAFKDAVTDEDVKVVHVSGVITFPNDGRISFQDQSDKTIFGLPGSKLVSVDQTSDGSGIFNAKRLDNIIFQNLVFEGPGAYDVDGNDNMTIDDSRNIWVDHCEFRDGTDGNLDIKNKSDFITVTWTTFKYLKPPVTGGSGGSDDHRYSNLFGSSKSATDDRGKLRITMQYCWWGEGVVERMPRIRFGKVHMANNLFDSDVSKYCIRMGYEADLRLEGNVFVNQPKPIDEFDNEYTAIYANNNIGQNDVTDGTAFTPPYTLSIANPADISDDIQSCAGATLQSWGGCSACAGNSPVVDCNGVDNGTAYYDDCDVCVGGNTGQSACEQDCSGQWGGQAEEDDCGVCDGSNDCMDCAGEIGGTAYLDDCGWCVGGNTGHLPCQEILQAETACSIDGILLEDKNEGFEGQGYVNTDNEFDASVYWVISSENEQMARIMFRFANGGGAGRNGGVWINEVLVDSLYLPSTGTWTNWEYSTIDVDLQAGLNKLQLNALTEDGLANIDALYLPQGVSDGSCAIILDNTTITNNQLLVQPGRIIVTSGQPTDWKIYTLTGSLMAFGTGHNIPTAQLTAGVYVVETTHLRTKFLVR